MGRIDLKHFVAVNLFFLKRCAWYVYIITLLKMRGYQNQLEHINNYTALDTKSKSTSDVEVAQTICAYYPLLLNSFPNIYIYTRVLPCTLCVHSKKKFFGLA